MPAIAQAKWFRSAQSLVWILFLVWTGVMLITAPWGIGSVSLKEWVSNPGLRKTLGYLVATSDATWFVLAAASVYLHALRQQGTGQPRRWAFLCLVIAIAVAVSSVITEFPLGAIRYTANLGSRLAGVVPLALPFLALAIVWASRYVAALISTGKSWQPPLITAALTLLTLINLEPIAWKVRAYWIWYPAGSALANHPPTLPPLTNFLTWLVLAAAAGIWIKPSPATLDDSPAWRSRPFQILILMNLVFLAIHLTGWLGWR